MVMGEFGRDGSGDENIGLKRVNDGLNRTVAALRSRVSELESAIDHGTGPEVERLTKEVSTLEDLLEETQRDNEAKHAESERQKQYVKDLENLLTELAGLHWRVGSQALPMIISLSVAHVCVRSITTLFLRMCLPQTVSPHLPPFPSPNLSILCVIPSLFPLHVPLASCITVRAPVRKWPHQAWLCGEWGCKL